MTLGPMTFITYLWHYLVARLVYDQLLLPLIHGHGSAGLLICGTAALAFAVGRRSGRRCRGRGGPATRKKA